jgi:hypothetical protein
MISSKREYGSMSSSSLIFASTISPPAELIRYSKVAPVTLRMAKRMNEIDFARPKLAPQVAAAIRRSDSFPFYRDKHKLFTTCQVEVFGQLQAGDLVARNATDSICSRASVSIETK